MWSCARNLSEADPARLDRVFIADTSWGVAAVLWISTGLLRAFGGFENGSAYYLHSHAFQAKMALLALVLALEIRPMTTLVRWRIQRKRGAVPDLRASGALARISYAQAGLIVLMVLAATAMARGIWM